MKICVAGGQTKASFLIESFLQKGHHVVVINDEESYAENLTKRFDMPIYYNDPTKKAALEEAEIDNFDILVALRPVDSDNLAICQMAKKHFNVHRTVAVVQDPNNVEIFRDLGVKTVISATFQASQIIERMSLVESIVNTLTVQNEKIVISNILIKKEFPVAGRTLTDIQTPKFMTVASVIRGEGFLIPSGNTSILEGDRILVISSKEDQDKALDFITGGL